MRKRDGAELVQRERLAAHQEAEWSARAGTPSPVRGITHGARELRFSLWLARHQRRTGRPGAPWAEPLRVLRRGVGGFASTEVSSAFPTAASLELRDDGVRLASTLAWRGGEPVPGTALERLYLLDGSGLAVRETLVPGRVRELDYAVPAAALEPRRAVDSASYRLA